MKISLKNMLSLGLSLGVSHLAWGANTPTVKVGVFLPMSGGQAAWGQDVSNGMKLAIEEINKAGKIKLDVKMEDEKSEPTDAANAAKKLINVDKVQVLVGTVASSSTNAAAPIAQAAKVPLITPASTNVNVTKNGDYISRICFIDDFQGQALAKFAVQNLKAKTAAIVTDTASDYSQGLAKSFREEFLKLGGKISVDVSYVQKDQDFSSQLTKIRTKNPDVVFVPGYYSEVGNMIRQAKNLKVRGVFLGGDGWSPFAKLSELAGDAMVGHYYSAHFAADDTDSKVQDFVKKYKTKFKVAPSDMSALGYDSMYVVADAVSRAGFKLDGESLKKSINSTKAFSGVTGSITLDGNRNASKPLVIMETGKGEEKFKMRVNP